MTTLDQRDCDPVSPIPPKRRTRIPPLPSNESVRTAVEAGAGVAVLSALVVTPAINARTLYAAPIDFGSRPFYGLRHKERFRTKASDALVDLLSTSAG